MALYEQSRNTVSIHQLKMAVAAILDHITDDLHINQLAIDDNEDFYWEIDPDDISVNVEPKIVSNVGSLIDDWQFLKNTLDGPDNAVSLTLIHASPLLNWIGRKLGQ